MIAPLFLILALVAADDPEANKVKPVKTVEAEPEQDGTSLLDVRRVYVDRLTGGETAAQIRDLLISALQKTKLFVITENEDRADAVLRGAAEDLLFTDKFSSSDGLSAHANGGEGSSGSSRERQQGPAGTQVSVSVITNRLTLKNVSTKRWPRSALVNKDGDVIWSTTQESLGAKFRGASADVADKVAKQLAGDLDRARKAPRLP